LAHANIWGRNGNELRRIIANSGIHQAINIEIAAGWVGYIGYLAVSAA
jgi:hypothetical protein